MSRHENLDGKRTYDVAGSAPFSLLHLPTLPILIVPFSPALIGWCAGSYALRMPGVTAGAHRDFRMARPSDEQFAA